MIAATYLLCMQIAATKPAKRIDHWNILVEKAWAACVPGGVVSPTCHERMVEEETYRVSLDAAGPLLPRAQAEPRCEALRRKP